MFADSLSSVPSLLALLSNLDHPVRTPQWHHHSLRLKYNTNRLLPWPGLISDRNGEALQSVREPRP